MWPGGPGGQRAPGHSPWQSPSCGYDLTPIDRAERARRERADSAGEVAVAKPTVARATPSKAAARRFNDRRNVTAQLPVSGP